MAQHLDIDDAYRQHGASVLRRARALLGSEQEAQDALQEVFLSLVQRPEQFQGGSSLTTFLYAMTTNLCLNRLRNQRTRTRLAEQHLAPSEEAGGPRGEDLSAARQLLARLPETEARLVVYYYLDELTQDEIADLLGIQRRQVGRLLERLQTRIREEERLAC
jgi:RNA polymerase sigma-70 factor (ECF subfamily)